jgi:hypothetical protein
LDFRNRIRKLHVRVSPFWRQGGEQAVGLFLFVDAPARDRMGLDIDPIGHGVVRHYGGGVGVHQHYLDTVLLEGAAGLGASVVEFGGLANDDGAGADDHDLFDVLVQRHITRLLSSCFLPLS